MSKLTPKEIEFLDHSNRIEREYSKEALDDAIEAWEYVKIVKKITLKDILKIHKILMERLNPRIAGHIRNCPVYIGGEIRNQSQEDIEMDLKLWVSSHAKRKDEEGIKQAHIIFEKIHPFEDSNGRTGRILMNLQRLNAGLPLLVIHEGVQQIKYYKWFKNG